MYCRDCIFGNLTTQEELKKAKEYWYSKMISEKISWRLLNQSPFVRKLVKAQMDSSPIPDSNNLKV